MNLNPSKGRYPPLSKSIRSHGSSREQQHLPKEYSKKNKQQRGQKGKKWEKKLSKTKLKAQEIEKEQKGIIKEKFRNQLNQFQQLTTEELKEKYEMFLLQKYDEKVILMRAVTPKDVDASSTVSQNETLFNQIDKKFKQSYWKVDVFLDYVADILQHQRKVPITSLSTLEQLLTKRNLTVQVNDQGAVGSSGSFYQIQGDALSHQELDYYENDERYYYEDQVVHHDENAHKMMKVASEQIEVNTSDESWTIEGIPLPDAKTPYRFFPPPPKRSITNEELELQILQLSKPMKRKLSPNQTTYPVKRTKISNTSPSIYRERSVNENHEQMVHAFNTHDDSEQIHPYEHLHKQPHGHLNSSVNVYRQNNMEQDEFIPTDKSHTPVVDNAVDAINDATDDAVDGVLYKNYRMEYNGAYKELNAIVSNFQSDYENHPPNYIPRSTYGVHKVEVSESTTEVPYTTDSDDEEFGPAPLPTSSFEENDDEEYGPAPP